VLEISGRMRSVARGELDFKRTEKSETAQLFSRSSVAVAGSTLKALDGVNASVNAARVHTGKSLGVRLLGALAQLASRHVKSQPMPLSLQQRTALAVQRYEQKFGGKHPDFSAVIKNRANDPASFKIVMDVLQDTTTGNAFSCRADIEAFKNHPTLEAAKDIVDKYITDPQSDDVHGSGGADKNFVDAKPMAINLYRSSYLAFKINLAEASFAIARGDKDAGKMLENVFDGVVAAIAADIRNIRPNIEGIVKESKSKSAIRHPPEQLKV
jgi:hypothetical protein